MARFTLHELLADSKEHVHRCEERYGSSREPDTPPIIDRAGRESIESATAHTCNLMAPDLAP